MMAWLGSFLRSPVGAIYALRLARVERRLAQLGVYQQRERELHREHLRTLAYEHQQLLLRQIALRVAARQWEAGATATATAAEGDAQAGGRT